jgi:hypothetical protein
MQIVEGLGSRIITVLCSRTPNKIPVIMDRERYQLLASRSIDCFGHSHEATKVRLHDVLGVGWLMQSWLLSRWFPMNFEVIKLYIALQSNEDMR